MDNYICIHGNKVELTEEQIKQLGFEVKKENPFERVECGKNYYRILSSGYVDWAREYSDIADNNLYNAANYCTDKSLMEQRALHEILNRLLWRYSMEHDGDKIDWRKGEFKWAICRYCTDNSFQVYTFQQNDYIGTPYFYSNEIAINAIKEIVEPFMKEHPEFKW
jgi:hypothetical protein